MTNQIARQYTIILEAKDRGTTIQLSSSATVTVTVQDGNNHLPRFLGKTVSPNPFKVTLGAQHLISLSTFFF